MMVMCLYPRLDHLYTYILPEEHCLGLPPLQLKNKPEIVVLLSFILFDFRERSHFGYIYINTLLIQLSS